MELTLDSALSIGGAVGHLSYFLLVLSMLMRRIGPLRVLAILSAVAGITYDTVWLKDPVGVFWEVLLLTVNVGQLGLMYLENRRATFSQEEVMTQGPATSTAVLSKPSRYWAADARVLRQAADADPDVRRALNTSFSSDLSDKLVRSNRVMAEVRHGETSS